MSVEGERTEIGRLVFDMFESLSSQTKDIEIGTGA